MREPAPVRPDVLLRMRKVITIAIATRSMSARETAAKAHGLGCGLRPALPAEAGAAAVTGLLLELRCCQAPLVAETLVTRLLESSFVMMQRRPQPGAASGSFTAWRL